MANKEKIKILIVSYSLSGGGAERFTSTLLNFLDYSKFKISICLVRHDITYKIPSNIQVVNLGKKHTIQFPLAVLRLRKHISETGPDVIMSNISYTSQLTGLALMGNRWKGKWIIRIGGNPEKQDAGWKKWMNRFVYPRSKVFVANSIGLANGIVKFYPFADGKTVVIQNPTDFEYIDKMADMSLQYSPPKRPVIISVGRLDFAKRYDILLAAFKKLKKSYDVELWILGTGALKNKIEQTINEYNLIESVTLFGFQHNPYIFMKHADIFAMTSDHEGMPNALVEAQGLGLPAISTNCPYGPEEIIIPDKTGILISVGNTNELFKAFCRLLNDRSLCKTMSAAGRSNARKKFNTMKLVGRWEKLFLDC